MCKDIKSFHLPDIDETYDNIEGEARGSSRKLEVDEDDNAQEPPLNPEQSVAYDEILAAIYGDEGGVLFTDGP
jgi:hypothetical protein